MKRKIPQRNGHHIKSRARMCCYYCGTSFDWDDPHSDFYPTRDHKHPRSKGGSSHASNITLACKRCNQEKADMPLKVYREFLEVTRGVHGTVMRQIRWKKHLEGRERAASQEHSHTGTS